MSKDKDIFSLVKIDLVEREAKGFQTYQKALMPNSIKDWLQEAYEEALDMTVYLRGELESRRRRGVMERCPLCWGNPLCWGKNAKRGRKTTGAAKTSRSRRVLG